MVPVVTRRWVARLPEVSRVVRADVPAARQAGVEEPVWRAVAVFRAAAVLYAVVVFTQVHDDVRRPGLAAVVLASMAVWSVVVSLAYRSPSRRTWPWLGADLLAAVLALGSTRLVDAPERIESGAQTLPVIWPAAAVLAFAVKGGARAGGAAALVVGVVGLLVRGTVWAPTTLHNVVLLLLVGTIVGYVLALARRAEDALARAHEAQAATRERERIARAVHDGVLQVLALVQRRGAEMGGPAAELGRLAGEQEVALRTLVSNVSNRGDGQSRGPGEPDSADLRALLTSYASGQVTVSTPAAPVLVDPLVGWEVAAAVGAALDNVARHAPGARAWVLLEDDPDELLVTVRDDGPGFGGSRLAEAAAAGRLGVAQSIRGRVEELGGRAELWSRPGAGTEVELHVPRTPALPRTRS